MYLTKEEEDILNGERGEGLQKAMEILVALGNINDADRLIPISSAHISGVSYKTIGDAGLDFLQSWTSKDVSIRSLATLNPIGLDFDIGEKLGYKRDFINMQKKILSAYLRIGAIPTCSCTPYLTGNLPVGEDIAWSESSAVIFANSFLGARTNMHSGISALASAIIGKTPYYGMHLKENRLPSLCIDLKEKLKDTAEYAALGYYVGKSFGGIPIFKGLKPSIEEIKALGAALAINSVPMFYLSDTAHDVTEIEVGMEEINETYEDLSTTEEAEIICIGCPHSTMKEILEVLKARPKKEVWIFTSRQNKNMVEVKQDNIKVIADTCMVVSPLEDLGISSIGVNSAKAAFYSKNFSKIDVKFDSLENLI